MKSQPPSGSDAGTATSVTGAAGKSTVTVPSSWVWAIRIPLRVLNRTRASGFAVAAHSVHGGQGGMST
jgi:hypothetical protein